MQVGRRVCLFNDMLQCHFRYLSGYYPASRDFGTTIVNGKEDQSMFHFYARYPVSSSHLKSCCIGAKLIIFLHSGCICGFISTYFWLIMLQSSDKTYWTAPALLTSIIELDVGIIVGCMPVIQVALLRRFTKIFQLSPLRSLRKRFLLARSKAPSGGAVSYGPNISENGIGRPYLETDILHGADGEGNFMSSVEAPPDPQSSWLLFPCRPTRTWTLGRSKKKITRTTSTLLSDQSLMVTASVSSNTQSYISLDRDPNRSSMMPAQNHGNMV